MKCSYWVGSSEENDYGYVKTKYAVWVDPFESVVI